MAMSRVIGRAGLALLLFVPACGGGLRRCGPTDLTIDEPRGLASYRGTDGAIVAAVYDLGADSVPFRAFLHGHWLPPYEAGIEERIQLSHISRPCLAADRASERAQLMGAEMTFHREPQGEVAGWDIIDRKQRIGFLVLGVERRYAVFLSQVGTAVSLDTLLERAHQVAAGASADAKGGMVELIRRLYPGPIKAAG
jgi:hypothetical protein